MMKKKYVKNISTKELHKEIDLIQSCINRMSKNSFSCKSWNLTLIAGVFALTPEKINNWYICIVIFVLICVFGGLIRFLYYKNRNIEINMSGLYKKD